MSDNLSKLMQQAKELQANMKKAQDELAAMIIIGTAGGDMVQAHVNGLHYCKKVILSEAATQGMSPENRKLLEAMVAAAINDATAKIEKRSREKLSALAGTLGTLPEGFGGTGSDSN